MTRLLWTALLAITPLAAQDIVTARAGVIYSIEGPVTIDGQPVVQTSSALPQLNPGQILTTTRSHAEMFMGQDATLWTGNNTQVRLDEAHVDAPRVALLSGSAILEIKHTRSDRTVFIDLGAQTVAIQHAGIYRLDRSPDRIRVWSGAVILQGPPGSLTTGQSAENGRRGAINKRDKDALHYFAAYRSLALEQESGRFDHWKYTRNGMYTLEQRRVRSREPLKNTIVAGVFKHSGFDLEMSLPIAAARAKYLIASEAGLVNFMEGSPFRLGPNAAETVENTRSEIFLGLGITARLNHNTRLHLIDTNPSAPVAELEFGEVMIEVAKSAKNTYLRLQLGDSTTEIHKPGIYRFNKSGAVALSATTYGDEFFDWNSRRSLFVFLSDASFMADWQPMVQPGDVKHKQYGVSDTHKASVLPVDPPKLSPGNPRSILDLPIDQSRSQ